MATVTNDNFCTFDNIPGSSLSTVVTSGGDGWDGITGTTAFSISVWYQRRETFNNPVGTFAAWGVDRNDIPGQQVTFGYSATGERIIVGLGGGEFQSFAVSGTVQDEQFHHLVATFPGGSQTASASKAYQNGIELIAVQSSGVSNRTTATGVNFQVGELTDGSQGLYGRLDEIAVWNTELSSAEVVTIYNSGVANLDLTVNVGSYTSSANGQLWWRFEEGPGSNPTEGAHQEFTEDSFGNGPNRSGRLQEVGTSTFITPY